MKHHYPSYFNHFRCIAADCPDSCCQGWDVVIDSDTEAFYHTVQGDFGDRLREAIYTDPDGDRVFRLAQQKKCPFWGADRLCDIYRELGKEHLCATCAQFPRITMDYTTFAEHTLALACPEASRLILTTDNAYMDFSDTDCRACEEYSAELMSLLLDARLHAQDILTGDISLTKRFEELLLFAQEVQKELTGTIPQSTALSPEVYEDLEYIDENNRARITQAASTEPDFSHHNKELTNLALYWLYRYWLGAIDTLDVIAPTRFIISAVGTVAVLAEKSGDFINAAQTYSKEIEQSYENMEMMWNTGSIPFQP